MSPLHNSRQAFIRLRPHFNPSREEFWLIHLDASLKITSLERLSEGEPHFCPVRPRDLFRTALKTGSFALILAHNHPSGNPRPTRADLRLTRRLVRLSHLLGLPIVDHLIFSTQEYYSFRENGRI